ncbi:winged helix-turn-helix domain-containing protein [Roseovarius sp. EL26]|uniref:winged helix-turn-helix domain-containing protein n=1 Tax=Roseovarius sp. EL26 TaxID=2126672 RepID=UPI000EA2721D|nr:crosslink repair DNA glycosylase YcaQ family protein [Roseovarius sp. EL26]
MTARLQIPNKQARHLWLWTNGLSEAPTGPLDVMGLIRNLGFVQIDTIRNVTRAHNHIIWSRNQNYREGMIWDLLAKRELFEHFTHDASLIPMEYLPMWRRQFRRLGEKVSKSDWYQSGLGQEEISSIRKRIELEGALSTHAFETKADKREMWARPPHKKALDQMWYSGELATCHRENFVKYYDLGERVFPASASDHGNDADHINKLCNQAIDRLSVATTGEIQRFWDAMNAQEAKTGASGQNLVPVSVQGADGLYRDAWAVADIEERLLKLTHPTIRLRILNPFDPMIRDRIRLERLFGFAYRNEMFVPKAKRRWGYYVYPLLEGDRFVGRLELKADRAQGGMQVIGFWPEPGVKWGAVRLAKLDAELQRFARLAGITAVHWAVARPKHEGKTACV